MIAVCILGILTVLELIVLIFVSWGVDPAYGRADPAYGPLFLIGAVMALFVLLVLISVGGVVERKRDLDDKLDALQKRIWRMEGDLFAPRRPAPASAPPARRNSPGKRPDPGSRFAFPKVLYPENRPGAVFRTAPEAASTGKNPDQPILYPVWGPAAPATPSYLGERNRTEGPSAPLPGCGPRPAAEGGKDPQEPARPDGPAA